jgi:hypothetical protein
MALWFITREGTVHEESKQYSPKSYLQPMQRIDWARESNSEIA